jgi:hypothetical protein
MLFIASDVLARFSFCTWFYFKTAKEPLDTQTVAINNFKCILRWANNNYFRKVWIHDINAW